MKKVPQGGSSPQLINRVSGTLDFNMQLATLSQITTGEGGGGVEVSYVLYSVQTGRARARAKLNVCISVLIFFCGYIAIQSWCITSTKASCVKSFRLLVFNRSQCRRQAAGYLVVRGHFFALSHGQVTKRCLVKHGDHAHSGRHLKCIV